MATVMFSQEQDPSTHLGHATRDDLAQDRITVVPIGAFEQHGPHLPLATDTMLVEHFAHAAAKRLSDDVDVDVVPAIPFGYSHHHYAFGGSISLSMEVCRKVLYEVCGALLGNGRSKVFILNGHGGNSDVINVVARELAYDFGAQVGAGSYWLIAERAIAQAGLQVLRVPGHAGQFETSLVQHCWPHLVRQLPEGTDVFDADGIVGFRVEGRPGRFGTDGWTDHPSSASQALGAQLDGVITEAVAHAIRQYANETAP